MLSSSHLDPSMQAVENCLSPNVCDALLGRFENSSSNSVLSVPVPSFEGNSNSFSSVFASGFSADNLICSTASPPPCARLSVKKWDALKQWPRRRREVQVSLVGESNVALECAFCGKRCGKAHELSIHLRMHTGQKPFQCVVCGRAFSQKSNVRKHLEAHKVWPHAIPQPVPFDTDIQQPTCSEATGVPTEFPSQSNPLNFSCHYCDVVTSSYSNLRTHLNQHRHLKMFQCVLRQCRRLFRDIDELVKHQCEHEGAILYQCPFCDRQFTSLRDVGFHQLSHSVETGLSGGTSERGATSAANDGQSERRYRCLICGHLFKTERSLEKHTASASHLEKCPVCAQYFNSARQVRQHYRQQHATQSEASFGCKSCAKAYKSASSLKAHTKNKHSDAATTHRCSECGAKFSRKFLLNRHMQSRHSGRNAPLFVCGQCARKFHREDSFKAHALTHATNFCPHRCSLCGNVFRQSRNLRSHIAVVHQGKRPYKCEQCARTFSRRNLLARHCCRQRAQKEVADANESSV